MVAREIAIIWVPMGLEPLTSYNGNEYQRESHVTLKSAIYAALTHYDANYKKGFQPWLRAGAGDGAHLFNISGIRLLDEAYKEGHNVAQSP